MRVLIRHLAAVMLLAAACLVLLLTPGWEVLASGNGHMHAEAYGEWANLLGKLERLAETSAAMTLIGIFVFRTVLLPAAGGWATWPTIDLFERTASVATFYALILAGTNNVLTFIKVAVAIVWLLAVWEAIPNPKNSIFVKGLCVLAIIPLLHIEGAGVILSFQGMIDVGAASVHTASGAIWFGGGLSIYGLLSRKPELPVSQLRLLLARFMTWAAVACCGITVSSLIRLPLVSGVAAVWGNGSNRNLMLLKLLLILVIVWVAVDGYRRWKRAGDDERGMRFRFKQSLRFSLSLTMLVLLLSAMISSPALSGRALKEPVYWHVMGEEAHMSLRIREHNSGGQHVRLDIWLPSGMREPISAEVSLHCGEQAVEVPITFKKGGPDPYGYEGFDKFTYEADGSFISESGAWTMKVVVTDEERKRIAYEKVEVIP